MMIMMGEVGGGNDPKKSRSVGGREGDQILK
jgi:hypothetical protein